MNARLRGLAAVAAGLLLAVGLVAPATAGTGTQPPADNGRWLTCPAGTATTGTFGGVVTFVDIGGTKHHFVDGYIRPCTTPQYPDSFAVVTYGPRFGVGNAYPFPTTGTAFGGTLTSVPNNSVAACLIAGPLRRLSCVELVWDSDGLPQTGAPISVDDYRVQGYGYAQGIEGPPDPTCEWCLDSAND
ncbi:hypothetical protein [Longispora urticae]